MHQSHGKDPFRWSSQSYLDGLVLVRGAEGVRPGLHQLQHLLAHVLVGRRLEETAEHLAVLLGEHLLVNGCAAVLDDALEDQEGIAGGVRVGRVHLLLDGGKGILGTANNWLFD